MALKRTAILIDPKIAPSNLLIIPNANALVIFSKILPSILMVIIVAAKTSANEIIGINSLLSLKKVLEVRFKVKRKINCYVNPYN